MFHRRPQTARHIRPHFGCLISPNLPWETGGLALASIDRNVMVEVEVAGPAELTRTSQGERCGPRAAHAPPTETSVDIELTRAIEKATVAEVRASGPGAEGELDVGAGRCLEGRTPRGEGEGAVEMPP